MDASLAFVGSGAALGMVLGSSLLGSRRSGLREEKWLALLLVGISAAMISITLRHAPARPASGVALELVEYVAALLSGPLFAGYVRSRSRGGLELQPLLLVHFVPAAIIGLQMFVTGQTLLPFRYLMLVQFAYTTAAAWEIVTARRRGVTATILRWPVRLVSLAILIHAAQVVRALFFDVPQLRNIVPITAIAGLELLAILAFREAILAPSRPAPAPRERVLSTDDAQLLSTIDAAMLRDRLWADPDLSLDRLAMAVRSTPHRVSSALNAEREGFFEYLSSWRLDAVRASLEDPANDVYTIDALAENAGFRSRSTFYTAFRKRFGITPSQIRRRSALPPSVSQATS